MTRKTFYTVALCLLAPLVFYGQHSLTGVWSGTLTNDSTTIRREQSFEMALTQYREKVYGYSRTTFIVNDTLYYVLKRVKGKVEGDVCEVRDDEIISYNFPGRLDKGIKVTTTFRMNKQDTTWNLDGNWSTNKTKKFYPITGKAALKQLADPSASKIFAHLEELRLSTDFNGPNSSAAPAKAAPNPALPGPAANNVIVPPAAEYESRRNGMLQEILFTGDSLEIALYDNGEIDGDTVSILLNGELILPRQVLKATAVRKTIAAPAGTKEFMITLYAENLGLYPPNTGLLVVKDAKETHQIRFSADLQQNATIIFRRRLP